MKFSKFFYYTFFLLSFLVIFFGGWKVVNASVIFEQSPMDEVYSGAVLDTEKLLSFGCTFSLNCGVSGQKVYNVGIWIKKIGNPMDVRLAVVDNWASLTISNSIYSNPISADSISDKYYTLKWFYFPDGVVIGNQYSNNQFFQIQFSDVNITYNGTDYYRVLQHDTDDYSGPPQWCKNTCFSSKFFFKLDNSTENLSLITPPEKPTVPFVGNIFSQSDFSETYTTTEDTLNVLQSIGKGNSGTVKRIKIRVGQDSNYEWNGMYWIALHDMGTDNIYTGGDRRCIKSADAWDPLTSKGIANRDIIFDEANIVCTGGMTLELDPTHYYAVQIMLLRTSPWWTNTKLSIEGSSSEISGAPLYITGTSQHPTNVQTAFIQVDGIKSACTTGCFSNVLFLPGLEASRLYKQKDVLGVSVEDQLWEPNTDEDVKDLYLDGNGNSINLLDIYTRDIIGETNILPFLKTVVYKSLIQKLNYLVSSGKIKEWKSYAYDWRQGVGEIIQNGTKYDEQIITLVEVLQSLVDTSDTGKVTIITHSNGGLLAKALIKKLQDENNDLLNHIDNLILVASPQLGTPEGLFAILHGYDQKLPIVMSESQARQLAQNMPSAYGLLPSKKYYEQSGVISPIKFTTEANQLYTNKYGADVDKYSEQRDFVLGEDGRSVPQIDDLISPVIGNLSLLDKAEVLHDSIDNIIIPPSIKVIQVAGWGKSTITGMTYMDSDIQPIYSIRGDKTVFMPSALYGNGTKYWLDLSNSTLGHKDILEDPQLLDFISSIIQQKPLVFSTVVDTEPIQVGNRLHLSVHSPVTIGVTDKNGNFTGKVCDIDNCYVQENIPGSTYQEFGEGKYVTLAEDKLEKVTMQGTGIGTFSFNFEKAAPDGTTQEQVFINIPVTTQTKAEVKVDAITQEPKLDLDIDGDNVSDFTITPQEEFDPIIFLQIVKRTIEGFDISKQQKKILSKRIDDTIKAIQKGKIDKAKLKIELFEKSLAPKSRENKKHGRLDPADIQILLVMLNQLLDNLDK